MEVKREKLGPGSAPDDFRARQLISRDMLRGDLEGEALVIALDLKGLAVSGGSACTSGAMDPSHVMTAMGVMPDRARASLRFSLDTGATERDVDLALELVPAAVASNARTT